MKVHGRARTFLAALALVSCATSQKSSSPSVVASPTATPEAQDSPRWGARKLPPPNYLPDAARALLGSRMQEHGFQMTNLLWAILFVEDDTVREIAERLREGPWIAEPEFAAPDDLNRSLPRGFFVLQKELQVRAADLASVATKHNPGDSVAASFARLAETCVRCHKTYLLGGDGQNDSREK